MDDLELTELFVSRRKLANELAKTDEVIKQAILERGDSFSSAGVKATYYNPSKTLDYEAAAKDAPEEVIKANTKITESVSWKSVCEALEIPEDQIPVAKETPARVVVK